MTWQKKIKMPTISTAADPRGQSLSYLFVPNVHFKVAEFGFQVLTPVLPFPCHFLPSYHPPLSSEFCSSDPLAKAELLDFTTWRQHLWLQPWVCSTCLNFYKFFWPFFLLNCRQVHQGITHLWHLLLSSPVLPFSCTGMILAGFPLSIERFDCRNPLIDNSQ